MKVNIAASTNTVLNCRREAKIHARNTWRSHVQERQVVQPDTADIPGHCRCEARFEGNDLFPETSRDIVNIPTDLLIANNFSTGAFLLQTHASDFLRLAVSLPGARLRLLHIVC